MPQLLLELFSEEIPARMQARAEADLLKALTGKLAEAGLSFGETKAWSGPRRLGVCIEDVAAKSEDVREERKGPKVGAPEKAVEGFMRGAGLASIDEADVRSDPKKGEFYVAVIETPGRVAKDIIAEAVPDIIRSFHWPKSMRTGTGEMRWVRPLQRILCVLGGKTVAFEVDGLKSGKQTEGHRVHGRGPYKVADFADYEAKLTKAGNVVLTREARREIIAAQAETVCAEAGLKLREDAGLLEEVVGLAEFPVVLLGDMDPAFLELPPEVIQLSMRTHQKYFAVEDAKTGALAPNFIVVANLNPADGGAAIKAGNAKVLSARLDDARFFWDNDQKVGLEAMAPKLAKIAFKEELGSIGDKVERVAALARELAPKVGADPDLAERAARLAKADLVSEMVYEFPELQGVMGRYYALETGEDPAVAEAISDHYKPQGPSDAVPTAPVSIAVALADKLDTLVGFWAIDEKPTSSKDPFALRRAALGVVRIILENEVRLSLFQAVHMQAYHYQDWLVSESQEAETEWRQVMAELRIDDSTVESQIRQAGYERLVGHPHLESYMEGPTQLLFFFADRLTQYMRDQGKGHDVIDAVLDSLFDRYAPIDDLVLIVKRVEALTAFLETEDGANLLAGYKRAANILRAEEKKDGGTFDGPVKADLLSESAEHALHDAVNRAEPHLDAALAKEDFETAMTVLAELRAPTDAFFDSVMVNTDEKEVRANRLNLLAALRAAVHKVANFAKIEG